MSFWKRRKRDPGPEAGDAVDGATDHEPFTTVLGHPIIEVGRKELFEDGVEFCGPAIESVFARANLSINLDDTGEPPDDGGLAESDDLIVRWIRIDDDHIIEEYRQFVDVRLADGETMSFRALDWDLVNALRDRYVRVDNPAENWQLGDIDEGYLLIVAEPEKLDAIAQSPDFAGFGVTDLTGAIELRRGLSD